MPSCRRRKPFPARWADEVPKRHANHGQAIAAPPALKESRLRGRGWDEIGRRVVSGFPPHHRLHLPDRQSVSGRVDNSHMKAILNRELGFTLSGLAACRDSERIPLCKGSAHGDASGLSRAGSSRPDMVPSSSPGGEARGQSRGVGSVTRRPVASGIRTPHPTVPTASTCPPPLCRRRGQGNCWTSGTSFLHPIQPQYPLWPHGQGWSLIRMTHRSSERDDINGHSW